MSDNDCAGRIRYRYLSQFGDGADLPVEWTVTQAVDAFHQMCRREKIKLRGLVARSWMDWEAGGRPNWDYQDLLFRLFHTSPVHLGWAADYTPVEPALSSRVLAGAAVTSSAEAAPAVRELVAADGRHPRALLHLPPDTRDFTGRAEQVGEVSRLIAAAAASWETALPIVCLSGQAGIGKTTLAIHVAHRVGGNFRMLGLFAADFPAWNLAAVLETDADDAEQLLEQLVDAVLVDIAGVDATGLIRYRLHDLLRAFARECLAEAEPPGVREECLARLADQYIGGVRLASALVHPGTPDIAAPTESLLMEDVVRGDPWGWFMAERPSLVRLVEQAHAARLWSRTWQLAELLPVLFDWRAWEHTHELALDAARQAGDADAEAGIMRSLGALYRELGRYDEAVALLTRAAAIFEGDADRRRWAGVLRNLGDAYRYQGRLAEAIETFAAGLDVFRSAGDVRAEAGP